MRGLQAMKQPSFDGPKITINKLFDTNKLLDFQNNQKRHTIQRSLFPQYKLPMSRTLQGSVQERIRQSPSEYFNVYTRTVIPQIEARIEERLLHEYIRTLPNLQEKHEIADAYVMRRHRLSKMPEEADMLGESKEPEKKQKKFPADEIKKSISNIEGAGIRYHTYSDIGRYTVFPKQMRNRLFPTKVFGQIEKDEVQDSGSLGLMCREQALRMTNDLARLTTPKDRNIDYLKLAHEMQTATDVKIELLQDELSHTALIQDFSLTLLDYIE